MRRPGQPCSTCCCGSLLTARPAACRSESKCRAPSGCGDKSTGQAWGWVGGAAAGGVPSTRPPGRDHRPLQTVARSVLWTCSGPSLAGSLCLNREGSLLPFRFKHMIVKPKLRPTEHRLCSEAKEWRRGNLSSQLNFSPTWREWFDFKSKDKGRRTEANTGEAGTFRGRAGFL